MDISKKFSNTTQKMKASKIRELMKYAAMPDVISFSGGMPDPDHFPDKDVLNIIQSWGSLKSHRAMQYGATTGYAELVENLKKRMTEQKNINLNGQDLIVTTGGQQALFLISRIFLNPDDTILVEGPSFIGGIAAFLSNQGAPVEIPLEDDGINLNILENTLKRLSDSRQTPKFLYTIPNFQNPGGVTMSVEKRKKLYDFSIKHELLIVEDDPYGDLYFEGEKSDYLPVKSLGNDAPIIYASSFSKILCPGLRLGWCLGDKEIIEKIGLAKQSVDACSTIYGQVIASDYLEQNVIDKYLSKMRVIYKEKKDSMLECIKKYFPPAIQYTNPKGGFFIYLTLPDSLSGDALFKKVIEQNVAFVTGEPFHIDKNEGDKHIRLSYSNSTPEQIEKGIKVIGQAMHDMLG